MTFNAKTRYFLLTAAMLTAGAIKLAMGTRPLIVVTGLIAFLFFGNLAIYLSGSKERAIRRQQKRDYYAGNS